MRRRTFLFTGAAAAWAGMADAARETHKLRPVRVLVQGLHRVNLLPLVLAQQLGYFAAEGLDVTLQPVPASVRTLADLAEVPAQVFAGSFERTLYLSARGKPQQAFALMSRSPQVVLGVHPQLQASSLALRNLAGGRVGVPTSGGLGHRMAQLMLMRAGMRASDVQFIELPDLDQAVLAFLRGDVEAISHTDPLISRLERMGALRVMVDTRSLKECVQLFGGPVACTCLSAPSGFIESEPELVQGLTNGVVRSLKWLQTAGALDLVHHVPEAHMGYDRSVFLSGFSRARETLAIDGLFQDQAAGNVMKALARLRLPLELAAVQTEQTWTNRFAVKAKAKFRA